MKWFIFSLVICIGIPLCVIPIIICYKPETPIIQQPAKETRLFELLPDDYPFVIDGDKMPIIESIRTNPAYPKRELGRLNTKALESSSIAIQLFDGDWVVMTNFELKKELGDEKDFATLIWQDKSDKRNCTVLTMNKDVIDGLLYYKGKVYSFKSLGEDCYVILVQIDQSKFPGCGNK